MVEVSALKRGKYRRHVKEGRKSSDGSGQYQEVGTPDQGCSDNPRKGGEAKTNEEKANLSKAGEVIS